MTKKTKTAPKPTKPKPTKPKPKPTRCPCCAVANPYTGWKHPDWEWGAKCCRFCGFRP